MKASLTKEVRLKGMEISLENEEEIKAFRSILTLAYAYLGREVNPQWVGREGVNKMIEKLKTATYE